MQALLAHCNTIRERGLARRAKSPSGNPTGAPHPLPKDYAGLTCPITGLSVDAVGHEQRAETIEAFAALEADPDIADERRAMQTPSRASHGDSSKAQSSLLSRKPQTTTERSSSAKTKLVPLNVISSSHKANGETRRLFIEAGGLSMMRNMTSAFYEKCFVDPHIDQFLRRHDDPHGERFALWIAEKFGDGTPWTNERKTRPRDVMQFGNHVEQVAFDRSSAHFAAWHSPKRTPEKWGQHFKPDDARVWMRLHFWAARDVGLFDPEHAAFMDYYIRFIGHFISVYSSKSPPFTRESARWSADPENIRKYVSAGNMMVDVIGQPVEEALAQLPEGERAYTGSRASKPLWPYESR